MNQYVDAVILTKSMKMVVIVLLVSTLIQVNGLGLFQVIQIATALYPTRTCYMKMERAVIF